MILKNSFIINPDKYLRPHFKISPFSNQEMFRFQEVENDTNSWDDYVSKRWGKDKCYLTSNGREALGIALELLNVNSDSLVTIVTTSGNKYVSGCVTSEIEKFCKWNREIGINTEIILVIHEFGKTYVNLDRLKLKGLPIIEDCAYAFLNNNNDIGKIGDYCIYSLTKIFPLQIGGLITSAKEFCVSTSVGPETAKYMITKLNKQVEAIEEITESRNLNYSYLKTKLEGLGLKSRFDFQEGEIPGVYMFVAPEDIDLLGLKSFMYANGIECTVFYGENAFIVPCHQNLTFHELDYFTTVISTYFNHE